MYSLLYLRQQGEHNIFLQRGNLISDYQNNLEFDVASLIFTESALLINPNIRLQLTAAL